MYNCFEQRRNQENKCTAKIEQRKNTIETIVINEMFFFDKVVTPPVS
jgi:hypothetical protein